MKLWIRSQGKLSLVNPENLTILKVEEKWKVVKLNLSLEIDYRIELGTYNTEKRALEVLDEIHQRLIDLQTLELTNDYRFAGKRSLDCVYQMPKE